MRYRMVRDTGAALLLAITTSVFTLGCTKDAKFLTMKWGDNLPDGFEYLTVPFGSTIDLTGGPSGSAFTGGGSFASVSPFKSFMNLIAAFQVVPYAFADDASQGNYSTPFNHGPASASVNWSFYVTGIFPLGVIQGVKTGEEASSGCHVTQEPGYENLKSGCTNTYTQVRVKNPMDVFSNGELASDNNKLYGPVNNLCRIGEMTEDGNTGSGVIGLSATESPALFCVGDTVTGANLTVGGYAKPVVFPMFGKILVYQMAQAARFGPKDIQNAIGQIIAGKVSNLDQGYSVSTVLGVDINNPEETRVRAWGPNGYGQAGVGSMDPVIYSPTEVIKLDGTPLSGVTQISTGSAHMCAVTEDGEVYCWGLNLAGQVGPSPDTTRASRIRLPSPAIQVVTGAAHTCALLEGGSVSCWGDGRTGQLGASPEIVDVGLSYDPVSIRLDGSGSLLTDVDSIMSGPYNICAETKDDGTYCWGSNEYNQIASPGNPLCNDETNQCRYPVKVAVKGEKTHINGKTLFILDLSGQFWAQGYNAAGNAGTGSFALSVTPRERVLISNKNI